MQVTAYWVAERYVGTAELPGSAANPRIMTMLKLDAEWPEGDEVPWCSGFVNFVCWSLRLPRSKSLRARSWLNVGTPIPLNEARAGWDVVIFNRADGPHDPNIIDAPGHVAFFAGMLDNEWVYVLGGNQGDTVKVSRYPVSSILGVRRLYEEVA